MAVFLTKVWGFVEPCGPLSFGQEGWRKSARKMLRDGDIVVLVGTMDEPTVEEDRGRLLGAMEPTQELVRALDFDLRTRPVDFDEKGNFRWPHGLLNRQAWSFPHKPPLHQISQRAFHPDFPARLSHGCCAGDRSLDGR